MNTPQTTPPLCRECGIVIESGHMTSTGRCGDCDFADHLKATAERNAIKEDERP